MVYETARAVERITATKAVMKEAGVEVETAKAAAEVAATEVAAAEVAAAEAIETVEMVEAVRDATMAKAVVAEVMVAEAKVVEVSMEAITAEVTVAEAMVVEANRVGTAAGVLAEKYVYLRPYHASRSDNRPKRAGGLSVRFARSRCSLRSSPEQIGALIMALT
mmetsp:Transcript_32494/g.81783  ORF Transcript_32494/g.81783 Transcript_32494/m.81783 type:complete len:164 (-) Transcript_32494:345-836(-)